MTVRTPFLRTGDIAVAVCCPPRIIVHTIDDNSPVRLVVELDESCAGHRGDAARDDTPNFMRFTPCGAGVDEATS